MSLLEALSDWARSRPGRARGQDPGGQAGRGRLRAGGRGAPTRSTTWGALEERDSHDEPFVAEETTRHTFPTSSAPDRRLLPLASARPTGLWMIDADPADGAGDWLRTGSGPARRPSVRWRRARGGSPAASGVHLRWRRAGTCSSSPSGPNRRRSRTGHGQLWPRLPGRWATALSRRARGPGQRRQPDLGHRAVPPAPRSDAASPLRWRPETRGLLLRLRRGPGRLP